MERWDLEPSSGLEVRKDLRPRMDEPPPVKLISVEDVWLLTPAKLEEKLDAFYVGLWQFERDFAEEKLTYRAENFRLRFEIVSEQQPITRDTVRPQGIEIASLADAQRKLREAEMEYIRQRGLTPGQESLLVLDPAGNWIELFECRAIL